MTWLIYKCILLFYRATNIENKEVNKVKNQLNGEYSSVPEVARHYKVGCLKHFVVPISGKVRGKGVKLVVLSLVFLGVECLCIYVGSDGVEAQLLVRDYNLSCSMLFKISCVKNLNIDCVLGSDGWMTCDITVFAPFSAPAPISAPCRFLWGKNIISAPSVTKVTYKNDLPVTLILNSLFR